MKCSIDKCNKEAKVRGWCAAHYTMWQRHGDPLYKRPFKIQPKCLAPGCERKFHAGGYCGAHYKKLKETGTLEKINHTPEWGRRNAEARLTDLSRLDPTPERDGRRGYLATNTIGGLRVKASQRGIEWTLAPIPAYRLITSECTYCGRLSGWPDTRNGIDRVDNHKGYHKDNCVTCCTVCNTGKGDRTLEEFMAWVSAIYNRMNR